MAAAELYRESLARIRSCMLPRARLVLGHMGETLPFLLWRFDSRAKLYGVKLAKLPSDYIHENILVTTSGMCSAEPLACTISALGHQHVMFSADYPFESVDVAAEFIDHVHLPVERPGMVPVVRGPL